MECYFGSLKLSDEAAAEKSSVVLFSIPELGIKFKAPFDGVNIDHNDYASLLALLEFIDSNQKFFSNNTYQIFGNNHKIIDQVNEVETPPLEFSNLIKKTKNYRQKYRFSLSFIAVDENPVFQKLFD